MSVDLLTKHAHVLLCVARDPNMRLREIAECVGVTERSAQQLVCDLEEDGYLTRRRAGRRNVYAIHAEAPLPHDLEHQIPVSELLALLDTKLAPAN